MRVALQHVLNAKIFPTLHVNLDYSNSIYMLRTYQCMCVRKCIQKKEVNSLVQYPEYILQSTQVKQIYARFLNP